MTTTELWKRPEYRYTVNAPPSYSDAMLTHREAVLNTAETQLPLLWANKQYAGVLTQCGFLTWVTRLQAHYNPPKSIVTLMHILNGFLIDIETSDVPEKVVAGLLSTISSLVGYLKGIGYPAVREHVVLPVDGMLKLVSNLLTYPNMYSEACWGAIVSACQTLRPFWDSNATDLILDTLVWPNLAPFDNGLTKAHISAKMMLPTHRAEDVKKWFNPLLSSGEWSESCSSLAYLLDLFSRVAKFCPEDPGWVEVLPKLTNSYLQSLRIPSHMGKKPSLSGRSTKAWAKNLEKLILGPKDRVAKQLAQSMARLLVYTLDISASGDSNDPSYKVFMRLVQAVKSSFHPSSGGAWTSGLGSLLADFTKYYVRRIGDSQRDIETESPVHRSEIIKELIPLAGHAIYSKDRDMRESGHSSLYYICEINGGESIASVVTSLLPSLSPDALHHSHRTLAALEFLSTVSPVFFNQTSSDEWVEMVMWNALNGIDANDLMKSGSTLMLMSSFFAGVTIGAVKEKSSAALEDSGRRFLVQDFSRWALAFLEKLVLFICTLDRFEKKNVVDKMIMRVLDQVTVSFWQCLDEAVWTQCFEKLIQSLEQLRKSQKYAGVLIRYACRANPHLSAPIVADHLLPLNADTPAADLGYFTYILSQSIRYSGVHLLPHLDQLFATILLLSEDEGKGTRKMARKLLRSILRALTTSYPMEEGPLPPSVRDGEGFNHWESWYKFTELSKDADDLEIEWFSPTQETLAIVEKHVGTLLDTAVTKLGNSDTEQVIQGALLIKAVLEGCEFVLGDFPPVALDGVAPLFPSYSMMCSNTVSYGGAGLRVWASKKIVELSTKFLAEENVNSVLGCCLTRLMVLCMGHDVTHTKHTSPMISNHWIITNFQSDLGDHRYKVRGCLVENQRLRYVSRMRVSHRSLAYNPEIVLPVFNSMLRMTLSQDPPLRSAAISAIGPFVKVFRTQLGVHVVDHLVSVLGNPDSSTHALKGAIALFKDDDILHLLLCDWSLVSRLLLTLVKCDMHVNDVVQAQLHGALVAFAKQVGFLNPSSHQLSELLVQVCAPIGTNTLHWRYELFSLVLLCQFLQTSKTFTLDSSVCAAVLRALQSELIKTREVAIVCLYHVFRLHPSPSDFSVLFSAMREDHPGLDKHSEMKQGKDAGGAAEFIKLVKDPFLSSWPGSRVNVPTGAFNFVHAKLVEFSLTADSSLATSIINQIHQGLCNVDSREDVLISLEMLCGLVRYATLSKSIQGQVIASVLPAFLSCCDKSLTTSQDDILGMLQGIQFEIRDVTWFSAPFVQALVEGITQLTPLSQVKRVRMLQVFVSQSRDLATANALAGVCSQLANSQFQQVRDESGKSLMLLFRACFSTSPDLKRIAWPDWLSSFVKSLHSHVSESEGVTMDLDEPNRVLETVMCAFLHCFTGSNSPFHLDRFSMEFLPAVLTSTKQTSADATALAKAASYVASEGVYPLVEFDRVVDAMELACGSTVWNIRRELLSFIATWVPRHTILLNKTHRKRITEILVKLMKDTRLEVRELACVTLSRVFMNTGLTASALKRNSNQFVKLSKTRLVETESNTDTAVYEPQTLLDRHCGVLGLSAMVYSHPFDVPEWLPAIVARLAGHAFDPSPIGSAAKKCISEFQRSHLDSWHIFEEKFTSEQLSALNDVNTAPSYFA